MKTVDTKTKFIELRGKGYSYDSIASSLLVSKPVLIKWGRELALEVKNQRQLEIDKLQEEFFITKNHRLALLGEEMKKIRQELAKRDYSNVPTEKLLNTLFRYVEIVKEEESPITLQQNVKRTYQMMEPLKYDGEEYMETEEWEAV